MRLRFILFIIAFCCLIIPACGADSNPVRTVIVDFPHGQLRLLIRRDGDTRLFYGALPAYRTVESHTFNIDDMFQQLLPRLHDNVPAENRPPDQPYGMATVEFSDGSEQDYLMYDDAFAQELFQTACANLVKDDGVGNEIVTAQCAEIGSLPP